MKQKMQDHVAQLCQRHSIRMQTRISPGGRAWAKVRTVKIKPVKSQTTYIVALHEIAHIVYPLARHGDRLLKEAAAWKWAIENSVVKIKSNIYTKILKYLASYLKKAKRVKNMNIPSSDSWFWEFYHSLSFGNAKNTIS